MEGSNVDTTVYCLLQSLLSRGHYYVSSKKGTRLIWIYCIIYEITETEIRDSRDNYILQRIPRNVNQSNAHVPSNKCCNIYCVLPGRYMSSLQRKLCILHDFSEVGTGTLQPQKPALQQLKT